MQRKNDVSAEDQEIDEFADQLAQNENEPEEEKIDPLKTQPQFFLKGDLNFVPEKEEIDSLLQDFKSALLNKQINTCEKIWMHSNVARLKRKIKILPLSEQISILSLVVDMINSYSRSQTVFYARYLNGVVNEKALIACLEKLKNDSSSFVATKKWYLKIRLKELEQIFIRQQRKNMLSDFILTSNVPAKKPRPSPVVQSDEEETIDLSMEMKLWSESNPMISLAITNLDLNNFVLAYRKILKQNNLGQLVKVWNNCHDLFKNYFVGNVVFIKSESFQIKEDACFYHFELALKASTSDICEAIWFSSDDNRRRLKSRFDICFPEEKNNLLMLASYKSSAFFASFIQTFEKKDLKILENCLMNWSNEAQSLALNKFILETNIVRLKTNNIMPVMSPVMMMPAAPMMLPPYPLMNNPFMLFANPTPEMLFVPGQNNRNRSGPKF